MKCKNCGYDADVNAKFCGNCGEMLEIKTVEPAEAYGATENKKAIEERAIIEVVEEKRTGGIFKKVMIFVVVAVMAAGIAVFAQSMFTSPEVKVAKAFLNTGEAVIAEVDEIKKAMPIMAFLEDFATGQYTLEGEYEDYTMEVIVDMTMDNGAGQLQVTPSIWGFGGDILISKEYMTLEMAGLQDVYGVNLETLEEDMKMNGLLQEELPVGILDTSAEGFFVEQEAAIDGITDILNGALPEIITLCSVEELGKEGIAIGEQQIDTDAYKIILDTDGVKSVFETVIAEILADEAIVTYCNRQLINFALAEGIYIANLGITDLQDTTLLEGIFAAAMVEVESISGDLQEVECIVNIYQDKIASIYLENNGDAWELQLGIDGKILERMASIRTFATGEVIEDTYVVVLDGTVLNADMNLNGDTCSLVYDIAGGTDNFVVDFFGEIITLTLDCTSEDLLEFVYIGAYEEIEFVLKKAELVEGWFVQKTEFVNALELTEEELQEIMMQALFSDML